MATFKPVRLERAGGVAKVVLDRPPLNVLDIPTIHELDAALQQAADSEGKVIVIAAAGKAFSAGVDVKDHAQDKVREMIAVFHGIFRKLFALPQPTICAVQGPALGGGMELAIACDFILASEQAQFGQPEIKVGAFPPIACLLLPRLVPWPQALELILTGEAMSAAQARALGMVNRIVPAQRLGAEVEALAGKLASLSGPVLRLAKRAALRGRWGHGEREGALAEIERIYLEELMELEDAHEGLRAFLEKRKPSWKDR